MLSLMEDDRYADALAAAGGSGGSGGGGNTKKTDTDLSGEPEGAARLTLKELAEALVKSKESAPVSEDVKKMYNGQMGTETVTVPVDTWTGADPGLAGLTVPATGKETDVLDAIARLYGVSPSRLNPLIGGK